MALCDYRLCDKCNRKAFYDANLNYGEASESSKWGLDCLGDWAVLCELCSKEWQCVVVARNTPATKGKRHE